jgi:hypothetical protein
MVREDDDRAARLDFAAKRVRGHGRSLAPPTADGLRAEDRDWGAVFSGFVEEQERAALARRHAAKREQCEMRCGTSVALETMRKREQTLAVSKHFREAAEMKERADALQLKLAMQTLIDRQRDEIQEFEERKQQGFAFIESERAKARRRLPRLADRADRPRRRDTPRKTFGSGWRERVFGNFDGLALRRYCAEKRAKTAIAPVRGRWT